MHEDNADATKPKQPASETVKTLVDEPAHNYDGLPPPALPTPPGEKE